MSNQPLDGEASLETHALRRHAMATIRTLMEFWGLTPDDLERALASGPPLEAQTLAVKYRHPVSGDTWTGQGSQPEWLRHALTREGYTVEELRAAAASAAATVDPAHSS